MAKAKSAWRRVSGEYHYNGPIAATILWSAPLAGWVVKSHAALLYHDGSPLAGCAFGSIAITKRVVENSIARHMASAVKPRFKVGDYLRVPMGEPGLVQVLYVTAVEPSGRYRAQHSHFEGEAVADAVADAKKPSMSWSEAAGRAWDKRVAAVNAKRNPPRGGRSRKSSR